ncbi:hypothetical protein [Candidatus Spongiihabitans sp.]|uniref:hypothetical protein n=1 Tax=Candidatus Spongiihabitans sp. TaxID=3101308 RepID=UPI003C7D8351
MNKLDDTLDEIIYLAREYGLVLRGVFCVNEDDNVPEIAEGVHASTLILFGNAGSSFWECFSGSREVADGQADPLNRWSQRVGADQGQSADQDQSRNYWGLGAGFSGFTLR